MRTVGKQIIPAQGALGFHGKPHVQALVQGIEPYYATQFGAAYLGDSREIMARIPDGSVSLVFTSPPYALHFKKEYGNEDKENYVEWFLGFAREFHRILPEDGSFVLNIGGSYNPGEPTRSLYHRLDQRTARGVPRAETVVWNRRRPRAC